LISLVAVRIFLLMTVAANPLKVQRSVIEID